MAKPTHCEVCRVEFEDTLGPPVINHVRIDVSLARREDLERPFTSFPAQPLVQWAGDVCGACVSIAGATAAAFERARRERVGDAIVPAARSRSTFLGRLRRAAAILWGE